MLGVYPSANGSYYEITDLQLEFGSTASDYTPYVAPSTASVTFPHTVYGGTADVVLGSGSGAYAEVKFGTLTFEKGTASGYTIFTAKVAGKATEEPLNHDFILSCYKSTIKIRTTLLDGEAGLFNANNYADYITIRDDSRSELTGEQFKTELANEQIVYRLATPTPYTFPPASEQLTLAKGTNNAWAEMTTGD